MQSKQCMFLNYNYFIPGVSKNGNHFRFCCSERGQKSRSNGSIIEDHAQCLEYIRVKREELGKGVLRNCKDCQFLVDGQGEDKQQNSFILNSGLPGGSKCNAGCIYCDSIASKNTDKCIYGVLDIFKYTKENFEPKSIYMSYASAEITISEYYEELLNIWEKARWRGIIFTSGIKYSERISELLRSVNGVSLNISLDSGTAETYKRIKRVDKFDAVLGSINSYNKDRVELKYNLIHDYNSTKTEIDQFLTICSTVKPKFACLSNNQNEKNNSDEKLCLAKYFLEQAYERSINVNLILDYFSNSTFHQIKDFVISKPHLKGFVKYEYK